MQPGTDGAEYAFLTTPGASLVCRLAAWREGSELQLFGNRAGLLSLANILLWFIANSWRREFLSLGELGFARLEGQLTVCIRLSDDVPVDSHGKVRSLDGGESLEWAIAEEGLQQVALWIHHLVCQPEHEYDRLLVADSSEYGVHIRMTDAAEWLARVWGNWRTR
jgi:hypothetical protein